MCSKLTDALTSENKKILMVQFLYTSLKLQHYSCEAFIVVDLSTFTFSFQLCCTNLSMHKLLFFFVL